MTTHDWYLDWSHTDEQAGRSVFRCKKCGCYCICYAGYNEPIMLPPSLVVPSRPFKVCYKPAEWTWNPFKTLKTEPPCPAHW